MLDEIPLQANAKVREAVGLMKSGYVYEAIRVLRREERDASASKALALAYYLAGQHILFQARVKRLMQELPDDYAPWYYMGRHLFSDVEDFRDASGMFREALKRNPEHARSLAFLGASLGRMGMKEEAREFLERSLRFAPGMWFAHLELARMAMDEQNYVSARTHAKAAAAVAKANAEVWKTLAKIRSAQGEDAAAVALLQTAASLDPDDVTVLYQLQQTLRRTGQTEKARAALEKYQQMVRE